MENRSAGSRDADDHGLRFRVTSDTTSCDALECVANRTESSVELEEEAIARINCILSLRKECIRCTLVGNQPHTRTVRSRTGEQQSTCGGAALPAHPCAHPVPYRCLAQANRLARQVGHSMFATPMCDHGSKLSAGGGLVDSPLPRWVNEPAVSLVGSSRVVWVHGMRLHGCMGMPGRESCPRSPAG